MPERIDSTVVGRGLVVLAVLIGCCSCEESRRPAVTPQLKEATAAPARVSKPPAKKYERQVLSRVYHVDKIYKSMTGPNSTDNILLKDSKEPELLWITGFEARMVAADGKTEMPQQYMCHTNLDVDPEKYMDRFAGGRGISGRLVTLSQGQYRIDFPKGYGIPIVSTQPLDLNTQVLNLNEREAKPDVRHQVTVRFVRDVELARPYVALYSAGVYGLKLLQGPDGHHGVSHGKHDESHGPGCLPGANASNNEFEDGQGRTFTGHWVVKPGREVNHTRVTEILNLPYDTTVHYIAVHLHPFANSMALRDLTTDKIVWRGHTRQLKAGVGLEHVDFLSSEKGVPLFKGHEYEVESVYENTSGADQDSMAVFNLYLRDMDFQKPDLSVPRTAPSATASGSPTAGDAPM